MVETALSWGRLPPLSIPAPGAKWLALAFVLAGLTLPDCCLNGHHAAGFGMEAFGVICRAQG